MFLAFVLSFIIGKFFAHLGKELDVKQFIVGWVMVLCALVSALCGLYTGSLVGALVWGIGTGLVTFLLSGRKKSARVCQ